MDDEPPSAERIHRLRRIADYQFGRGAGAALLGADREGDEADADDEVADRAREELTVTRTRSGRVEQCFADGERLFTMGTDGRLVVSVAGGRRLVDALDAPSCRVEVGEESVEYVREGRNAFAKFVREADPAIRPRDDVVVVHDGAVLAVGRAELSASAMADFDTGVAVHVRHGADG